MLKISAGILFLCGHRALLAHSTKSPWWRSYTPPKGGVEKGETLEHPASREVFEEIGIRIDPSLLKEHIIVEYRDRHNKLYKKVVLFVYRIYRYSEIGLEYNYVPHSQLQLEEIDEARFMTFEEAERKLLPRYLEYLKPFLKST